MSSAKAPKFWKLLAFRLTLLYGGVLVVSAFLCFLISYILVASAMRNRTDADLLREAANCTEAFQQGGLPSLKKLIDVEAPAIGTNDIFFLVYSANRDPVASSNLSTWEDLTPPSAERPRTGMRFDDSFGVGHHAKLRVLTYAMDSENVLQIGITVQDDVRVMEQARRIAGLVMLGLVGVAIGVGWLIAKRALSGVQRVTNTANEIARGVLGRRVPTSGSRDEVDELATTINRMLGRIQTLVEDMQATNDNIAHELRSPITRVRGLAETTLIGNSSLKNYREMAASTIDECDRLLAIINTMLDIAEAEGGVMSLKIVPFDIVPLIQEACEIYEPMIDEKEIRLSLEMPETAAVKGDIRKIQRVVANLLDNAVKYTPHGGIITISVVSMTMEIHITVSNSGSNISSKDLPNIFKRFYRGDASRSGPGNGLGLSLAQAIVHAHGGRIAVRSQAGEDTFFAVNLPAAHAAQRPLKKITDL
jgi:heavy metal sensor kinase